MLVPGHIVSCYVATGGLGGAALGSDEKDIALLVFVIIEDRTTKIIGTQQYLVKPTPSLFIKERVEISTQPISPELPITESLLHAAGKPLNEVIEQFDQYLRSLQIDPNSPNFKLVCDGQLPMRQCLHPEASAKDINLPAYYWKFSDLRKEYVRSKSGDLSRALIPLVDAKKLPNMPSLPALPLSLDEIMKELELTPYVDNEYYVKESRDMVTIIQALLSAGHKFENNEIINAQLEPGICSIDDEIDGSCIVRARGLPWQSSDQDIAKFFRGLNVAKGGVALCLSPQGRRNGEALVRFISQEHRDMALKRHKHHIGNRYIEVYRSTGNDFLAVAGGASNEAQAFLSKGAQVIIRMRGLPYDCTAKQVLDFFTTGENPCQVMDGTEGVLFVKKPDGRATGDAFVLFESENDASKALSRHRESIGQRYIELFRSTTAEVQQVLNRSLDPKTYDPPPPAILPQLPQVQMPIIPQHVITSGTAKDCIRLRGLPYEAKVENILHFLDEFAKHIVFQGVHMVYNSQGQPSGECFIQMDSEQSAFASAQQKHNKYMVFGKKHRYIEVFQCSGEDMNLVLTGLHPSSNSTKPALLSPGGTMIGPSFGGYTPFAPPATILPPRGHPAFYPQTILYWGYPSPPVSPTTYYGPAPHPPPHHVAPQFGPPHHQPALLPVDYIPTHQQPSSQQSLQQQIPPTTPILSTPQQSIHHALPAPPQSSPQLQNLNQSTSPIQPITTSVGLPPLGATAPTALQFHPPPNYPAPHIYSANTPETPHDKILSPRVLTPVGSNSVVTSPNHYFELYIV